MNEIIFYTNPQSRGRIVHWMLEEIGAPYRVELLDFATGQHKRPDYLAINPMGKVPTIVHDGVVVTECAAICAYLADRFPQRQLAPGLNDPQRGTYLRWLYFGAGCVEPALVDRMFSRPPPGRVGILGYGSHADVVHALQQAITPGPFILGERFSAADVYIGSLIGWGMTVNALERNPLFEAYFNRCSQRAALQRAVAHGERLLQQGTTG